MPTFTAALKLPAPLPDADVRSSQVALDETDQVPQPPENVTVAGCAPVFSAPLLVAPKNIPVLLTATRVLGVGIGDALHPPPEGALGFGGGAGFGSVGPGDAGGLLLDDHHVDRTRGRERVGDGAFRKDRDLIARSGREVVYLQRVAGIGKPRAVDRAHVRPGCPVGRGAEVDRCTARRVRVRLHRADSRPRRGAEVDRPARNREPVTDGRAFCGCIDGNRCPGDVERHVTGIVIVRSGLVEVTSSVAVWTPGSSPALDAITRNVFVWVRSAVPAEGVAETQRSSAGAFPGKAAVHPVATTLGLVTFMTVVDVVESP